MIEKDKMRFKKLLRPLVVALLIISSLNGFSQSTGNIKVITNPGSAIIRLDTMLLKSGQLSEVKIGEYTLKMWAHKRQYFEQKILITSDTNISIVKVLKLDDDFIMYRKKLKRYGNQRFAMRFVPITVFAGLTVLGFKRLSRLNNEADIIYNSALETKESYDNALVISDIESTRRAYNRHKTNYDEKINSINLAKTTFYGTIAVGAVVSWYFIKKSGKLEKPSYENKKLLSRLQFDYQKYNDINSFSFTYNF